MIKVLLFNIAIVYSLHVCGNYCGPHYCNGKDISEEFCDEHVLPERWKAFGSSCSDTCCRHHDRCCRGDRNMSTCNADILKCLRACNPFSLTCTRDGIPVAAGIIEFAMNIVENWCCGSPCY